MLKLLARIAWLLALVSSCSVPARALAQDAGSAPLAVVETFHVGLLNAMRNARELGFDGRAEQLGPLIERSFDFAYISRLVIGKHWLELGESDRGRFRDLLAQLTVTTYAARFDAFDDERFESVASKAGRRERWQVRARLVLPQEDDVTLDYVLHRVEGGWRIVNIVANGVSDLSIKRAEYASIIASQGFDGLLAALERQVRSLARDAGGSARAGPEGKAIDTAGKLSSTGRS